MATQIVKPKQESKMENHTQESLIAERAELSKAEYNSYSEDAFPGSAQWRKNQACVVALRTFDAAHPEIIAAIKAKQEADRAAKYAALSDFVKAGS